MCGFYCDLWIDRCPEEIETFEKFCKETSKSSMCTSAVRAFCEQSLLTITALIITAYLV